MLTIQLVDLIYKNLKERGGVTVKEKVKIANISHFQSKAKKDSSGNEQPREQYYKAECLVPVETSRDNFKGYNVVDAWMDKKVYDLLSDLFKPLMDYEVDVVLSGNRVSYSIT